MFMAMKDYVTQFNGMAYRCVLTVFGPQWSAMAQKNKIYQALDKFIVGLKQEQYKTSPD